MINDDLMSDDRDARFLRLAALARRVDDFVFRTYRALKSDVRLTADHLGLELEAVAAVRDYRNFEHRSPRNESPPPLSRSRLP